MTPPRRKIARKTGSPPLFVAGIGISSTAAALVAELMRGLRRGKTLAYVVVSTDGIDGVRELLEAASPLPVVEARHGARLAAGTVYLAPADREVVVSQGRLSVKPASETTKGHLLDFFLVSLARELKERAVGVLLSGPAAEGAQGIAAIRAQNGVTLVQDPRTAMPDAMPAAAIAVGAADFVLSPSLIQQELLAIARHGRSGRAPAARGSRRGDEELIKSVVSAIKRVTGADFVHYKRTTLLRRIERRMAVRRIPELSSYAAHVAQSPAEARSLHEEILIHVTSFFRDPDSFKALNSSVFEPLLAGRSPKTPIRVWVPGCSTGEEVYSLAISLCEFLESKGASFPLQFFGTDVSEKVVSAARQGKYADPEVPAALKKKYFTVAPDGRYQVCKSLRELCVFAAHDLSCDPPYSNLDLISCRNVLIYFDQALQDRVVPVFHYALNPSGFLMMGPSESIDSFKDLFAPAEKTHRIFSKKQAALRLPAGVLGGRTFVAPPPPQASSPGTSWSLTDLTKEADRIVLTSSAPGVVVSESLDILQFRGDVGPFLTPSPGKASFNLGKMAHEGLLPAVERALERAKRIGIPVVLKNVAVKHGKSARVVQLQAIPIPGLPSREGYFLVLFADPAASMPDGAEILDEERPETRERRLERELQAARRSLESIIDKQQSANEEIQSANEELRSRNEEYQSSLEELQTAHEELQSANEELSTLNDELRKRTAELDEKNFQLAKANDVLRKTAKIRGWLAAIVESSEDAIVSKDVNGVITSWNRGAERLFGYTEGEAVGQSITILIPEDRLDEEPRILEKIRRGERISHFETVRKHKNGDLIDLSLTISPIYDDDGVLVGISKVARDITDRKRLDQRLERTVSERTIELRASNEELEAFCYAVAHDLRAPLRGIRSYAQLLQRRIDGGLDGQARADFQRILDNAATMSELIDGLLDLSRLTRAELKTETVDLSGLVEAIARDLKRAHPERVVRFVVEPGLKVDGDPKMLHSLLRNLIDNSWKFAAKKASAQIEFGAARREGATAYFVRDDGAGFDPAYADKLFTAFQRLHHQSEFPGTGIGLATSKRIVSRHGGRIWAEGQVGKGAAFFFTLSQETTRRARKA